MLQKEPIFQSGDNNRIWQKYCGFLELTLKEFMQIQEDLLIEQINMMIESPIGKQLFQGSKPGTVEEFRGTTPLSTYDDYIPYIGDCKEDYLVQKPEVWAHTSGRGGRFKWIPYTKRALEIHGDSSLASFILATAKRKGDVNIGEGSRFLSILAPRPYLSGISAQLYVERFGLEMIPPPEIAEQLDFQERIEAGFNIAMRTGVDVIAGLGTVLVKMGDRLLNSTNKRFSRSMLHPAVLLRLLRAFIHSKLQHRSILPLDLWPSKGITCSGTDTAIYRNKIMDYWGNNPYEIYGFSEAGAVGMQGMARKGMYFYPYICFYEFMPEEEYKRSREDKDYRPRTLLINEISEGEVYVLVVTSFHGMPLFRYIVGDLIQIMPKEEQEKDVDVPQFRFHSRVDGLIDLYSIVRLDEKTVWQALDSCGIIYEDWSARKEYEEEWPILKIYIEPKQDILPQELADMMHEKLLSASPLYQEAISETGQRPVRVTVLPSGSFQRYYDEKSRAGADLANLKPPHMNASDESIRDLVG